MLLHRSRLVLPLAGPPIEDGALVADGSIIAGVGLFDELRAQFSSMDTVDHGETILLPGLINAHCHLDFTVMRGAILPNSSFSAWVRRINELKRTLTDGDYLRSIADGLAELRHWGTTTVLNIESLPELMVHLPPPPIRTWWFYELLDIRNRIHTEEVVAGALSFFEQRPAWHGGFGLSPHAPYTTSLELYRLARFCSEKYGMPFTTHLAESDEELRMFSEGSGPLFDFLAGLGRDMSDCGGRTPIRHLLEAGALPTGAILAHMNQLGPGDEALLAAHAGAFAIVHCPNCHEYFRRAPFPYETLRGLGFRISLGTDSCASNRGLNLFDEMQTFHRAFPGVAPGELLDMVTRHPAAALGHAGRLGELRPGARADFLTLPFGGATDDALDAVVENRAPPLAVYLNGHSA
ncbi:MAG: amidohydrolase family protein [Terrimicrobiaceae bacterium]|nr:amidohydrolase family protein [Terrimicrobiaceae bacterium]